MSGLDTLHLEQVLGGELDSDNIGDGKNAVQLIVVEGEPAVGRNDINEHR